MKHAIPDSIQEFSSNIFRWETWRRIINHFPAIPLWIVNGLHARPLLFFATSSPALTFHGHESETKIEMCDPLPNSVIPRTILIKTFYLKRKLAEMLITSGISFPIVVKPDVERMRLTFSKINSMEELLNYHEHALADYLIQESVW